MFKVPDWGNDIPKSDVDIAKLFKKKRKVKKRQGNNDKETGSKTVNNKLNGVVKPKKNVKKGKDTSGPFKSKEFNNNVRKRTPPGKLVKNVDNNNSRPVNKSKVKITQKNKNTKPGINKKILKKKQNPEQKLTNTSNIEAVEFGDGDKSNATTISDTSISRISTNVSSNKTSNSERERKERERKRKLQEKQETEALNDIEIQNFDTDEPDKLLLNAKRKKLNEKFESNDIEDELFKADIVKSREKNKNKIQIQGSIKEVVVEAEEEKVTVSKKAGKAKKQHVNAVNGKSLANKQNHVSINKAEASKQNQFSVKDKKEKVINAEEKKATVSKNAKIKKRKQVPITEKAVEANIQDQVPANEKSIKTKKNNQTKKNKQSTVSDKPIKETEDKVLVKVDEEVGETTPVKVPRKETIKAMLQKSFNRRNHIDVRGDTLRQRMLDRLKAAQFRYLNEKLYTSSGSEAQELFKSDPAAFDVYHEGYQLQVKKWPINPLDIIVQRIQKMPKSHLIADMGCGEAALSKRVAHSVRSFDLVARAGAEACDMARTPLLSASVDAAVYCLALMGTDLTRCLLEANRVLKIGGHLLIAEVESRFNNADAFASDVQRLGFSLKKLDKTHKVFLFLEFTKVRDASAKRGKLPELSLKPCLYKRR